MKGPKKIVVSKEVLVPFILIASLFGRLMCQGFRRRQQRQQLMKNGS